MRIPVISSYRAARRDLESLGEVSSEGDKKIKQQLEYRIRNTRISVAVALVLGIAAAGAMIRNPFEKKHKPHPAAGMNLKVEPNGKMFLTTTTDPKQRKAFVALYMNAYDVNTEAEAESHFFGSIKQLAPGAIAPLAPRAGETIAFPVPFNENHQPLVTLPGDSQIIAKGDITESIDTPLPLPNYLPEGIGPDKARRIKRNTTLNIQAAGIKDWNLTLDVVLTIDYRKMADGTLGYFSHQVVSVDAHDGAPRDAVVAPASNPQAQFEQSMDPTLHDQYLDAYKKGLKTETPEQTRAAFFEHVEKYISQIMMSPILNTNSTFPLSVPSSEWVLPGNRFIMSNCAVLEFNEQSRSNNSVTRHAVLKFQAAGVPEWTSTKDVTVTIQNGNISSIFIKKR